MRPAIERQLKLGRKVTQIAIARNDSWVMIAGNYAQFSRAVPTELKKAIIDARKQGLTPRVVKFQPNSDNWIFIAGQKVYASRALNRGAYNWANKYRDFNWEVNVVFFTPQGGWTII